jgi:hypothetical protein
MNDYAGILEEALEALRRGEDAAAIAARYPAHAEQLRADLDAVSALSEAYAAPPSPEWAAAARERFLIASGQRLQEAYDLEPSPSFFASARVKFLMAAHRMRQEGSFGKQRSVPLFGTPFRALASAAAAVVMFMGFSTYTVASAQSALPGDWHYGVKLQTERVRLALAFTDDAKRDVQLDIAAERTREVEKMAAQGKIIGPGVLDRLADQTQPLVEAAADGELNDQESSRLVTVTERQKTTLEQAAPRVAAAAQPKLEEALAVATDGVVIGRAALSAPQVVDATQPVPTREPEDEETPAGDIDTPEPTPTAGSPTATPTATPARAPLTVDPEPVVTTADVTWIRLAVGRFSTLIPSEADGWRVATVNTSGGTATAPNLVQLVNVDGTSLVTVNPRTGDTYWFVLVNGVFDEVRLRETRDGQLFVADREVLKRLYGQAAEIPLFIVDNITIEPEPTATPEPTSTPTAPPPPIP